MDVSWTCKRWHEVSRDDLYAIAVVRSRVFVVEQTCPYLDLDGHDQEAWHLWAGTVPAVTAYLRLLPPGSKYVEPSLGRIVTAPEARRTGLGRALVAEGLRRVEQLWGSLPVRIGAQRYLERFYREFGFETASPEYDEDGIPHVEMVRTAR